MPIMDVRKSVRFLLPAEGPRSFSSCEHSRDTPASVITPVIHHVDHHLPPRPPSSGNVKDRSTEFVCSRHRKQNILASGKNASAKTTSSISRQNKKKFTKNCHHDYEDVDNYVPAQPAQPSACPRHNRSLSASPQLARRLVQSHPSEKTASSSKKLTKEIHCKHVNENPRPAPSLKWNHEANTISCAHLDTEIERQLSCAPTSNHYSESQSLLHKTQLTKAPSVEKRRVNGSHYYFLPPIDPMLTSFIEANDVVKREVKKPWHFYISLFTAKPTKLCWAAQKAIT